MNQGGTGTADVSGHCLNEQCSNCKLPPNAPTHTHTCLAKPKSFTLSYALTLCSKSWHTAAQYWPVPSKSDNINQVIKSTIITLGTLGTLH